MLKIGAQHITKITLVILMLLSGTQCTKDQNAFLPYVRINLYISLINHNHLKIPGNSILFMNHGVKGVIVSCIDPNVNYFMAYDACCPYEKDFSGVIDIEPVKTLTSPPGTVYSSGFYGKCNKCGSTFSLMENGKPIKGPATHYLQNYNIITGPESITVTN